MILNLFRAMDLTHLDPKNRTGVLLLMNRHPILIEKAHQLYYANFGSVVQLDLYDFADCGSDFHTAAAVVAVIVIINGDVTN